MSWNEIVLKTLQYCIDNGLIDEPKVNRPQEVLEILGVEK